MAECSGLVGAWGAAHCHPVPAASWHINIISIIIIAVAATTRKCRCECCRCCCCQSAVAIRSPLGCCCTKVYVVALIIFHSSFLLTCHIHSTKHRVLQRIQHTCFYCVEVPSLSPHLSLCVCAIARHAGMQGAQCLWIAVGSKTTDGLIKL